MENFPNLCKALVAAFPEIENAAKDKTNPHFRSKYADLGNVVDAIKPALAKHGLAFVQVSHTMIDHAAVETVIIHSSGERMPCGVVAVPVVKADAQGFGSAMTYARRYSLSTAFGVAPEDDDGNAAVKSPPKPQPKVDEDKIKAVRAVIAAAENMPALINIWKGLSESERVAVSDDLTKAKERLNG